MSIPGISADLAGELIVNNTRQTAEECCREQCFHCRYYPELALIEKPDGRVYHGTSSMRCAADGIRRRFNLAPFNTEKPMDTNNLNNDGGLIVLVGALCDAWEKDKSEWIQSDGLVDAVEAIVKYRDEQRAALASRGQFVRPEIK